MFRFDLHSHTRYSDGTSSPDEIAKAAADAKLNVLALTDHNSNEGVPAYPGSRAVDEGEIHAVARALVVRGVQPIIGCEYSTAQGHLLVYGVTVPKGLWGMYPQMQDVIDEVNHRGGACIVPHAFHGYTKALKGDVVKLKGLAAVEGWNGRCERSNPGENRMARAAAEAMGCPIVASTDAHSARELGGCWTEFPTMIRNDVELVAALRAGGFKAVCNESFYESKATKYVMPTESFDEYARRTGLKAEKVRKARPARKTRPESSLENPDTGRQDDWVPSGWRTR